MTERIWTVSEALAWTVSYFTTQGVDAPRRSAEWVLSAATSLSRVQLYTLYERPLTAQERERLRELIRARASGMPLQYVTGEVCFRHVVLSVRPGVFIPRPETEVLVDVVLEHLDACVDRAEPMVADLCTGSGAVALSIAHERPLARVWATEIAEDAARAAAENAERLGLAQRVVILTGDLAEPLPIELRGTLDVLVSNPPYVPTADIPAIPAEVADFEPRIALDGGPEGLDVARRIMAQAADWLAAGGLLAMELDTGACALAAAELSTRGFAEVAVRPDLTGRDRIVTGRRAG